MLVVLEGIDGSGKGTHTKLLVDALRARGLTVATFSFPRYGTGPFAEAIASYLNGKFGSLSTVPPQLSALLYAGDRFAAKADLDAALLANDILVCDRYAASNLAHQGCRLPDEQRPEFIRWLSDIEYNVYAIPQAALTIYLDMPVDVAAGLVLKKDRRDYTDAAADIHERDREYLHRSRGVYLHLATHSIGGQWATVSCTDLTGSLKPIPAIQLEIQSALQPVLAARFSSTKC